MARNLHRDADFATAAGLFAEFIRNHPTSERLADARLLLARAYRGNSHCDRAIPAYESFFVEHAEDLRVPEAREERAVCLQAEERFPDAARSFEEIQRRFPARESAAPVLLAAAANYTLATDHKQAIRVYGKIIEEYAETTQVNAARHRLAQLLFALGNPEAAQALLERVADPSAAALEAPSALLMQGQIRLFLGNLTAAEVVFDELHRRFPGTVQSDSAYVVVASHYAEKRQFSQATKAFSLAFDRVTETEIKARSRIGLADALRQTGQIPEARTHYEALLTDGREDDRNHILLGLAICLGRAGDFPAAFNIFQQLIQAAPNSPEGIASFRELGDLYFRLGNYNSAITRYDAYLRAAPAASGRGKVQLSLARIYAKIGHFEQAIPLMRDLAGKSGTVATAAQFDLGQIHEQHGQPVRALREYIAFLERFPRHERARQAKERVDYINEFTILDPSGYNKLFQQAHLAELSGTPRRVLLMDQAIALFEHHDITNATLLFETYVAQYPDDANRSKAHYYLSESLFKLARQRQLEGQAAQSDSLQRLATQERRILAGLPAADEWSQRAQLGLIEADAVAGEDSTRLGQLEEGYNLFLTQHPEADNPLREQVLLRLADAQRLQPAAEKREQALQNYQRLLAEFPDGAKASSAIFGIGQCHALAGELEAASDSLSRILRDFPSDPLSPVVLLELGELLVGQGKQTAAVARLEELLLAYPAFPRRRFAQRHLADAYYATGDYDAAIKRYDAWLSGAAHTEEVTEVERRLATSYRQMKKFETALVVLRRALVRDPQSVSADSMSYAQAELLVELGSTEEAIDHFLDLSTSFPTSPLVPVARRRAGHLLFDAAQFEQAFEAFAPLLQEANAVTHGRAVISLFRINRVEDARKSAKAFRKRFKEEAEWLIRFRLEEGRQLLRAKEYERAMKELEEVAEKGGAWSDDGAYHIAAALWQQNQDAPSEEAAAAALHAQLGFLTNHPDSPLAVAVHLRLGNYYYGLGRPLQAAGSFKRALSTQSATETEKQQAVWMLVKSYQKASQHDEAHRTLRRLLSEFPEHPERPLAELELGIILGQKGQDQAAIAQFEKVLEWAEGEQAAEALYYIGESYRNMGQYREAIHNYYRVSYYGATASANWITTADYKRGECHEFLGEPETAIRAWERIVRREGTTNPFGVEAQKRIDLLRQRINQ